MTDREFAKREILLRHARLTPKGLPMVCVPSRRDDDSGPYGKRVIFRDEQAAEDAAAELEPLFGPQRPYECPRSRHGHFHLTSDAGYQGAEP